MKTINEETGTEPYLKGIEKWAVELLESAKLPTHFRLVFLFEDGTWLEKPSHLRSWKDIKKYARDSKKKVQNLCSLLYLLDKQKKKQVRYAGYALHYLRELEQALFKNDARSAVWNTLAMQEYLTASHIFFIDKKMKAAGIKILTPEEKKNKIKTGRKKGGKITGDLRKKAAETRDVEMIVWLSADRKKNGKRGQAKRLRAVYKVSERKAREIISEAFPEKSMQKA